MSRGGKGTGVANTLCHEFVKWVEDAMRKDNFYLRHDGKEDPYDEKASMKAAHLNEQLDLLCHIVLAEHLVDQPTRVRARKTYDGIRSLIKH